MQFIFLLDLEDESDIALRLKTGATRLQQTLTNSNILHPDLTEVTNSYPRSGSRMSTSLLSSRRSSLASSMDDLRMDFGTSTFSTNLGLSYVLNERNIHGGSTLSLDRRSDLSRTASMSGLFMFFVMYVFSIYCLCSCVYLVCIYIYIYWYYYSYSYYYYWYYYY